MKKIFIILLLSSISLLAQKPLIYYNGFEHGDTSTADFSTNGSLVTMTEAYGVAPEGSYYLVIGAASIYGTRDTRLKMALNLKAGREYTVRYYYRAIAVGRDTLMILKNSSYVAQGTHDYTLLAGTTKQPHQVTGSWEIKEYTFTPSENGGYLHMFQECPSTCLIDSLVIIGDTLTYHPLVTFSSPVSLSRYASGQTIHFTFDFDKNATQNVIFTTPSGTVNFTGSSYDWTVPDATMVGSFTAILDEPYALPDYKTLLLYEAKSLVLEDVVISNGQVQMTVVSTKVDSLKYLVQPFGGSSWTTIGRSKVDTSSFPNVTTKIFDIIASDIKGHVTFKVEEDRDTSRTIALVPYKSIGDLYDGRTSYFTAQTVLPANGENPATPFQPLSGYDIFEIYYVFDPNGGWRTGFTGYPGTITLKWNNELKTPYYFKSQSSTGDYNAPGENNNNQIPCSECPVPLSTANHGSMVSISGQLKGNGGDVGCSTILHVDIDYTSYMSEKTNSITYNNITYKYSQSQKAILVDDLLNGITNAKYCDLTELVAPSNPYATKVFNENIKLAIYLYPFETLYHLAYSKNPQGASFPYLLFCTGVGGRLSCPSISQAEVDTMTLPSNFIPMMLAQNIGGRGRTISFPFLKPKDLSPLLSDTWEANVTAIRNYFRGIHPKIWKYGQPDGVKR